MSLSILKVTGPLEWMKEHKPSLHIPGFGHEEPETPPSFGERFTESARSTWHDATARTMAAMMNACDAAAAGYDTALKRVGLREEERSRLDRAWDRLNEATARVWHILGYGYQAPTSE